VFGRLYDEVKDAPKLIFSTGVAMAFGIALNCIATTYAALLSAAVVGFTSGAALTVGFVAARDANKSGPEYEALAVGWVNGLQLSAGVFSPIAFSLLVVSFGYAIAWPLAGLYTLCIVSTIFIGRKGWWRER